MSHVRRDLLVGLTAFIGLIGLGVMLFLVGEFRTRDTYPLRVRLDTAEGLTAVSPVTLNGVIVGRIDSIRTADDPAAGVELGVRIYEGVRVPRAVDASISRTFVGDATLTLSTSRRAGPPGEPGFLEPGDTLTGQASSMIDQLRSVLDERMDSIDRAARSFERLSDTYSRVGARIEDLLAPRTVEDVDAGVAEPNIATAVERIERIAVDVEAWLGDEQLRTDAKRAVTRAATLFDQAAEAVETWTDTAQRVGDTADAVRAEAGRASADFALLSRRLGEAAEEIRAVSAGVSHGEGTLGMLLHNPDLYNSLNDAAIRLEKALLEAQLLVEKYRKEGIPINW